MQLGQPAAIFLGETSSGFASFMSFRRCAECMEYILPTFGLNVW